MIFKEGPIASIEGVWSNNKLETCTLLTKRNENGSTATATNYQMSSGKLVGPGTVVVGKSTFTGTWDDNGLLNGEAAIHNENQSSFQGQIIDNVREGQGTYTWPQGEYIGTFKAGQRHTGKNGPDSKMTWNTDETPSIWDGKWENGQCTLGNLNGRNVNAADM